MEIINNNGETEDSTGFSSTYTYLPKLEVKSKELWTCYLLTIESSMKNSHMYARSKGSFCNRA